VQKNILVITLSNIGDAILTLPVLDILKDQFEDAKINVIASERSACVFEDNPDIAWLIVYNKDWLLKDKIKFILSLRKNNYDLIVDLRNTYLPFFLKGKNKTSVFSHLTNKKSHMSSKHIQVLKTVLDKGSLNIPSNHKAFLVLKQDIAHVSSLLESNNILENQFIVIAPGARSHLKRWPEDKFTQLCDMIIEDLKTDVVLVGDVNDSVICRRVLFNSKHDFLDLSGKTTLRQLAALLLKAKLLITNDSATLHLASYFNVPVLAIFGPTDENKYGPWSDKSLVAKKNINCRPCSEAECKLSSVDCLYNLSAEEVFSGIKKLLNDIQTNFSSQN